MEKNSLEQEKEKKRKRKGLKIQKRKRHKKYIFKKIQKELFYKNACILVTKCNNY